MIVSMSCHVIAIVMSSPRVFPFLFAFHFASPDRRGGGIIDNKGADCRSSDVWGPWLASFQPPASGRQIPRCLVDGRTAVCAALLQRSLSCSSMALHGTRQPNYLRQFTQKEDCNYRKHLVHTSQTGPHTRGYSFSTGGVPTGTNFQSQVILIHLNGVFQGGRR